MAKNKKIPELSLQNTFKTAEKTLKMNTPSKKEKEEVDKKFGEKKSAGGAASLKKGPVTERRAAEIISESYAPPSPMPSQNRGRTGADVLKRAGEVWRKEKRTVSPYSGMSYREMTDDINSTYGGELRRGNIGQLDFYLERGKYDRERIEKAGREELSELLSEKENEYNILFEMPRYSGGNYDVIDSRAKEVKALYDEIQSRINTYDTNEKIKKDYEREFYKYGKEALQGDSTYHPTENGMSDYDLINSLNKKEDGKKNPLGHLTEGELRIYNSLYNENPQSPEKAEAFLKSIEGTLNKRLSDYETQEAYKYAKEHPYIAGAKSVAENVLGGTAAAIDNIAEGITGDVDTYDYTSRVAREGQALRQGGSQYMKENHGKGAEFAYGAGLSIVENLANIALFKGLGKVAGVGKVASGLSAFNMASGAAANSMINIADRGGSDIQILTGGVASGVAEYLFEKISFDKLFDIKSTKGILNMIKADAIQVGIEGSEEIFTEAANIISDALIMQGNSENNIRRRQYVMQGMSAEEATKKVFFETVDQIASAGAAGMLSGGIMGGGAIALNNISHNNYVNNMGEAIVNNKPALERLVQLGLDEGSADARFAAELIGQGESISGKEAGALLETIVGESISKNGGIANIIKNIYTLQGGDARYITSKKAIDTAMAVQHMAEGKVTDVDRALLQKSPGAVSLLSIVEGNEAAWKSLSGSATQTQNTKGKMQSEIIDERGTPYTQKELVDEDVYSNGQKVVIPENGRVAKNIVLNDESLRVRREKAKDYKNVETLAEDLEMKVMYVKGLTDSNGDSIGGIVTSKGIIINSDAENISRFVATHEFSHKLKQISPEKWNSYQSYVIDKLKTDGRYYDVFERKAAAYRSREDAIIDEEIASDYIGELFENETELAEFIRKDVKEASKVRNLWYNILDKLGLLDEKKKAQRLWASAYREGMSNKGKEFEGRKLSIQLTPENLNSGKINKDVLSLYEKDVDAVLNGTYTGDDVLVMGGTPKIYTDIGLSKLPITIKKAHVYSIAKTEAEAKAEGRYKKRENYHGLGANAVKNILYEISKPIAVIAHPDFAKYNANPNNKRDSTHKVIAIVELKVNGKNVIAPIEIDADLKYKNSQIDANNIATYFDKNNVENILGEALALESQNLTGFYFADKKRTEALLKTSGYQLPSWLRTHGSNTIIRSITENVNRKIDTALKSKQFIKWFGDWQNKPEDSSKAVNPDGTPMVLYHQTAEEIDIFDTRHEGAGTRDDETPFGIFLKPTPKDIGLKGKHQMALYANIRNPLEVANRNELVSALKRMSFEFSELYEDHKRIDKEYKSKSDKAAEEFKEYIIKWRVANPEASRQAIYEDEGFNQVYDAEEQIIEEWQEKAKQLELKTKEIITKTLEDNGYDGVHLLEDAGSFGRNVETWIALKPEQVKSATDNIGTYDGNNPNNKKSITGTRLSDIENERTAQLEAENAELKKQLENLNLQLNLSPDTGSGLDTQAIKELAKGIKTKAASKVRLSELHQELVKLYSYMGGTAVDGGEVNKRIDSIAEMVLSKSTQTIENEENAELLKRIKEMRIYVPESEREDFRDGFEYFRKHNAMGKITLANDGTDLDVYWDELSEEYPGFFDEDLTGSEERLNRILEVREELAPSEESLYNSNEEYEKAKANLKSYIKESYYNIPEGSENNKYVFYDKRTAEVQKELDKAREDVGKQKFRNEKEKIRRKLDSDYNYLRRMVTDPTDKKHLPEEMRASVAHLLDECFQYETKYTDKLKDEGKTEESPTAVKLEKMHGAYAKIIRQSWGVSASDKSEIIDEFLNEDIKELMDEVPIDESGKFKRIEDMSLHELRVISKVLAAVHHSVTQRNKAFNEAIKEELSQLGTNANADFESKINKKGEKLDQEDKVIQKTLVAVDKFFNLDNVQPGDFFHEIGGTIERLYKEERKAFDKYIEHIREGSKALTEATKNIDLKKLTGKKVKRKWFKLDSGYEIELTKGQMLSMYALYLRNQGKQHLLNGGIETRGNAKNALGEKVGSSNIYRVTEADIGKIFEEITDEERKMVAKVVMFLSQKCAKWGNETSMKLYGYEKFGEEWYFPIKVSRQALNTFSGEKGEGNLSTQGFSKNLVKEAKNPVELNDFFDVVTSHINGMALYNTIALPMLDLERVLNYTDKASGRNVRNGLMRAFGRNSNSYIETFHKDLNGTRKKPKETLASTVASKAKKASIGLNLRVLLQQPTSIARAFLFIDPLDINRKFNIKALTKEMQENIPIAYWKSLGFRDVGTGGNLKQVMLDNESLYDKVAMGGYGLADDLTWAVIYGSVKNEIKRKNKNLDVNSAEFKEKVLERFNYVVDRSQVVDSVFHRTQSMGSESDVVRNLNMFMSEPLKTYNMYRTELIDILRSDSKGEKIAKATRATAVFAVSNLLLAAAQALPDAWREDDEKELFNDGVAKNFWKELYVEKLKGAFYDDINPLTYFPYMNYVWSIYQGCSEKRPEFSGISEAISSVKGIWDKKKSVIQKVSRLTGSISALFGFSIRNAYRDLTSITRAFYTGFGEEYADYTVNKFRWNVKNESNQGKFMKYYKNAIQNGHPEEAELILSDYMAERFGGDFKNEKMAKVLKETVRLYKDADKDEKSKVLYSLPKDEYVLDGQIQEMNGSEYARFVEKTYNSLWDLAYDFVTSKEYKEFSDDDKISSFDELKSYVKNAQIMEDHEEYKLLKGWQSDVYSGEVTYAANALERKKEREYQDKREAYKETFDFDEEKYNEKEIGVIEKVESDAASYYASKEKGKEYNEKTLRHIKVYDEKLSSDMEIEEYAGIRAYAKKEAAMSDGKPSLKKDELKTYLDSTEYSPTVKAALFEAIGNKGWKNPYTGKKIGE